MRTIHTKHGDTKPWQKRFAWFPVHIQSGDDWYTVWLEHYIERKIYKVRLRPTKFGYKIKCGQWETQRKMIEWI